MTIKKQFATLSILPLVVALLVGLYVNTTNRHLQEHRQDFLFANTLAQDVFDLNFLSDRYLIYREAQIKSQWLATHGAIGNRLEGKQFADTECEKLRNKMRLLHREMGHVFTQLSNDLDTRNGGQLAERKERLSGALLIKAREMFTAATRLATQNQSQLAAMRDGFNSTVVILFFSLAVVTSIISALSGRRIIAAITRLRSGMAIVAAGNLSYRVGPLADDELGRLAAAFNEMTERLQTSDADLRNSVAALHQEVGERNRAEEGVRSLNYELARTVETLQEEFIERMRTGEELREKERLLILQSRQAALGEMIGNIAHQWRQPLNLLGLIVQSLPALRAQGDLSEEELKASTEKAMQVIFHMSQTIDDFRNFFRPDKEKVTFKVGDVVLKTVSLIEGSFSSLRIKVETLATGDPVIHGYPNEFSQVLINILLNARDVLAERNIANPRVTITMEQQGDTSVVIIADNGGGIPEEIMDKIFDPYFTTRGPDKGTGVGLFMSKTIVEKNMGGALTVRNVGDGAAFRIEV